MDERVTGEIIAELRHVAKIHVGRTRHECIAEAADRLTELDAEVSASHDQIRNLWGAKMNTPITELVDLCRKYTRDEWVASRVERADDDWVVDVCNLMARYAPLDRAVRP